MPNKIKKPEIKELLLDIINDSESNTLADLNENDIIELATGLSDEADAYYQQHIKENYIRKDKVLLRGVREIGVKDISDALEDAIRHEFQPEINFHSYDYKRRKWGFSIHLPINIKKVAQKIHKAVKGAI